MMFRGGNTMKFMRTIGFLLTLFGVAGFATSAHATREADPKAKDIVLKGDAKCTGCHDEADEPLPSMLDIKPGVLRIGRTKHGVQGDKRTPTCTNCHGESLDHNNHKGAGKPPLPDRVFGKVGQSAASVRNEACISCHQGGKRIHWQSSAHESGDVACNSCHKVHTQHDKVRDKATQSEVCFTCHKEQRAQMHRLSTHPLRAGGMACSDCHNTHGSTGPKLLTRNTINETCYTCHAEKRGPFLWEHPPATDDCMTCHTPHGSNQPTLLKTRAPYLCSSCHLTASGHPNQIRTGVGIAATGAQAQIAFKACLNCHTQVHGSNHPSGPRFAR